MLELVFKRLGWSVARRARLLLWGHPCHLPVAIGARSFERESRSFRSGEQSRAQVAWIRNELSTDERKGHMGGKAWYMVTLSKQGPHLKKTTLTVSTLKTGQQNPSFSPVVLCLMNLILVGLKRKNYSATKVSEDPTRWVGGGRPQVESRPNVLKRTHPSVPCVLDDCWLGGKKREKDGSQAPHFYFFLGGEQRERKKKAEVSKQPTASIFVFIHPWNDHHRLAPTGSSSWPQLLHQTRPRPPASSSTSSEQHCYDHRSLR